MQFVQVLKEVSTLLLKSPELPVTYNFRPKPVKFYRQKRFLIFVTVHIKGDHLVSNELC